MAAKRRTGRAAPYHHGDLRDALMQAARTILERDGLAALSLRGVARAAGVSPAAPYHHFPDKQALRDAVAEQGFEALTLAMTTRMVKKKNPKAQLEASGVGYITFAVENPALFALMFGAGQQMSMDTAVAQAGQRAYAVLQAAVAATSADGVPDPLVCLRLWGLVHGVAKLILEGCVNPADYGVSGGEALAVRLLRGA